MMAMHPQGMLRQRPSSFCFKSFPHQGIQEGGAMTATDRRVVLRLYITGHTVNSRAATDNLRRIIDEELLGMYELEVIDVLEHPQLAEEDKILATPTLIKILPPPIRKVIGDLSDRDKVLLGLDLTVR